MPYKNSRVDKVLENVSIDYRPTGFICDKVLTPLPVPKYSGKLGSYGNSHLRLVSSRVKDRGEYKIIPTFDYSISTNYEVVTHGLKDLVTERDRAEIEAPFEVMSDVTMGLKNLLMIEKEKEVSDLLTTSTNYSANNTAALTSATKWSNYGSTTSDPVKNINDAKVRIWKATGIMATTLIADYDVIEILRSHPKLANVYGMSGVMIQISMAQLKAAFNLSEIIIGSAQYVNDSDVQSRFWGSNAVVTNRMSSPQRHQRTFGYYLTKRGMEERVFNTRVDDPPNTSKIISDMTYNYMLSQKDAGYLFTNVV